mmetsp:Transcript_66664/g.203928  ORF Transcript_66664/g.203928 Transcript_66664/m.203928 type:complete len:124 (-) Transcript_66664:135-506(-)
MPTANPMLSTTARFACGSLTKTSGEDALTRTTPLTIVLVRSIAAADVVAVDEADIEVVVVEVVVVMVDVAVVLVGYMLCVVAAVMVSLEEEAVAFLMSSVGLLAGDVAASSQSAPCLGEPLAT